MKCVSVEIQGLDHLSEEAQERLGKVISQIIREDQQDEPEEVAEAEAEAEEIYSMSSEELWETKKRVIKDFGEILRKIETLIDQSDADAPATLWYGAAKELTTQSRKLILSGLDVAYGE